jgi:uncharacterized protein
MVRKQFRVGRSRTGLGLFATEFIKKGTFIVEYKGRRMRNADADKLADSGAKYLYEINNRWTVDGSSRRNVARYANHSCRPNAESDTTRDRRIIIRSTRNIYPGDEITYDYGKDYFDLIIKPLGCKCDKCLGKPFQPRPALPELNGAGRMNGKAHGKAALNGKAHLNGKAPLNGKAHLNGKAPNGKGRPNGKLNGKAHLNGKSHLNGTGRLTGRIHVTGKSGNSHHAS